MRHKARTVRAATAAAIAGMLLAGPARPVLAAAPEPVGSRDFRPSASRPIGFRGDGTGVYPGASPPTRWSERTGQNIVWKTPMPTWGHASPIVVGEKVFVCAEPHTLVCVDAADGRILWRRDVDRLAEQAGGSSPQARCNGLGDLSAEAQADLQRWHRVQRQFREGVSLMFEYWYLTFDRDYKHWCGKTYDAAAIETLAAGEPSQETKGRIACIRRRWAQLGRPSWDGTDVADLRKLLGGADVLNAYDPAWRTKLHALYGVHFRDYVGWVGMAFATPVSDGEHVYVSFGHGQAACFDLAGNRKWLHLTPMRRYYHLMPLAGCPSPVLAGDRLVVHAYFTVLALDKRTGKVIWQRPYRVPHYRGGTGTPAVVRVGDVDVVFTSHGTAYRLVDGVPLLDNLPAQPFQPTACGDLVLFGRMTISALSGMDTSAAVKAFRVSPAGNGRIRAEPAWQFAGRRDANYWQAPVVHDGRVYVKYGLNSGRSLGVDVLDLRTGRPVAEWVTTDYCNNLHRHGSYGPDPAVAGGRLYVHLGRGDTVVFALGRRQGSPTAASGAADAALTEVGRGEVVSELHEAYAGRTRSFDEIRRRWLDRGIGPFNKWTQPNLSFRGERIYLRTIDSLYCIGRK